MPPLSLQLLLVVLLRRVDWFMLRHVVQDPTPEKTDTTTLPVVVAEKAAPSHSVSTLSAAPCCVTAVQLRARQLSVRSNRWLCVYLCAHTHTHTHTPCFVELRALAGGCGSHSAHTHTHARTRTVLCFAPLKLPIPVHHCASQNRPTVPFTFHRCGLLRPKSTRGLAPKNTCG